MPRRGNLKGIPLDAVYGRTIVHANRFNGRYTPAPRNNLHFFDTHQGRCGHRPLRGCFDSLRRQKMVEIAVCFCYNPFIAAGFVYR